MKKNEVKEINLKVKSGMISLISADSTKYTKEALNEDSMLFFELKEIYDKFLDDKPSKI